MDHLIEETLDPLDRVRLGLDSVSVQSSDLPDKIKDWLGALNSTNNFVITPQKSREDGCLESYPPVEGRLIEASELGRLYGPGKYRFAVEYRPTNWTADKKGRKSAEPSEWFILSEEGYADLHKEYKEGKQKIRLEKLRADREERLALQGVDPLSGLDAILSRFAPFLAPLMQRLLAPPPPPPPVDNSLLGVMITIMNENSKRAEESARQQQEFNFRVQQENTKLLLSLNTKNDSSDKVVERMFGMVDNMLQLKTRVEQFNAPNGFTSYEPEEKDAPGGIDWKEIIQMLGTMLIPQLGMLSKFSLNTQQALVGERLQSTPGAEAELAKIRDLEENRAYAVRAFVEKWGIQAAKQVLDIGGFAYTEAELLEAEALARQRAASLPAPSQTPSNPATPTLDGAA